MSEEAFYIATNQDNNNKLEITIIAGWQKTHLVILTAIANVSFDYFRLLSRSLFSIFFRRSL